MIDVMKRLAELDAQNPNIVKEGSFINGKQRSDDELVWKQTSLSMADAVAKYGKENVKVDGKNRLGEPIVAVKVPLVSKEGVEESLEECGMMGGMGSQPHSPASINMTAATGEELSSMLKDIMTLAGQHHMHDEPMGGEEPMGGADGIATVDVEPSPEVGADSTSVMRSMIDKLNPPTDDEPEGDDDSTEPSDDDGDDEKKVDEYDNTPAPETAGYDSAVPSGNDLHKEKQQFPAAQPGDNAMTMEQRLMAEYKKFISEN